MNTDWTFKDLHPDVIRAMKAIREKDWDALHEVTKGAAFQAVVEQGYACDVCQDRGWYAVSEMVSDRMVSRTMSCEHCLKGHEMKITRERARYALAELPSQYQRFTFETWQSELTDSDQEGKQAAYMASVRYCEDPQHMIDLHEIYDILGMEWEDWRDSRPKNSLVFFGDYGTGKTGLASAIANYLLSRGETVLYIRCRDLVRDVQSRYGKQEMPSADDVLRKFQRVPVLFVDEFNLENLTADRLEIIEDVIRYRYGNMLPTIMTCNIDQVTFKEQWGGRTGDAVIAMAHWIYVSGAKLRRTDSEVIERWYQR